MDRTRLTTLVLWVALAACSKRAPEASSLTQPASGGGAAPTTPGEAASTARDKNTTAQATAAPMAPSPTKQGGIGAQTTGPNLSVERAVAKLKPELRQCYLKTLAANPSEAGSMKLSIAVAADGTVREAKVVPPTNLSASTLDCMVHAAQAQHFDAVGEGTTIVVPFMFDKPRDDAGL